MRVRNVATSFQAIVCGGSLFYRNISYSVHMYSENSRRQLKKEASDEQAQKNEAASHIAKHMSTTAVNDQAVDNFFKQLGEFNVNVNRGQRRRVAEAASGFWRDIAAGSTASALAPSGGSSSSVSTPVTSGGAISFRAAKEQGVLLAITTNATTGLLLRPRALGHTATVEIGKTNLSETERWKLQAALRREETKSSGEKYNQTLLRETKVTKGPTPGEAWPAHRGRPTWNR